MEPAKSWPEVVAGALDKVPIEHFGTAFWVLLGGVLVVGFPFLRKLLMPAQSPEETEAAVARGIKRAINGDMHAIRDDLGRLAKQLTRLDSHVGILEHVVEKNRQSAKEWHEENSGRLDKYDRVIDQLKPWDRTTERRNR